VILLRSRNNDTQTFIPYFPLEQHLIEKQAEFITVEDEFGQQEASRGRCPYGSRGTPGSRATSSA
jgi:hypothetical protein